MRIRFPWFTLYGRPDGHRWRCLAAMLVHEALEIVFGSRVAHGNRWAERYAIGGPSPKKAPGLRGFIDDSFIPEDGDVLAYDDETRLYRPAAPGGGGSTPGAVRVIKHDFDYTQAAALATGVTVYTPAIGDWLLDAWIENDDPGWTADGDEFPIADIGTIEAGAFDPQGLFSFFVALPSLTNTWNVGTDIVYSGSDGWSLSSQAAQASAQVAGAGIRESRFQFRTTTPLKLVVSGDGTPSGAVFDGSAGAATLYLMVCTPA